MTPEQRTAILGIATGWALITTAAAFSAFIFVADNMAQAMVYSGFFYIFAFVVSRWWHLWKARRF